ncbi:hypothetical protein GCM10009733_021080 [Nonomuraea maheshkhaliensis]|uniref:Uncharacterized protein n=1 Tax=Nonomuraea maheshkhaliensis TaxID=419590 RepID=A0ABN2EZW8_9ACTN
MADVCEVTVTGADLILPPSGGIFPRAWTAWAVAVGVSFAALETAALLSTPGPKTLSAQLRRRRHLSGALIGIGAAWLVHHIILDGEETHSQG